MELNPDFQEFLRSFIDHVSIDDLRTNKLATGRLRDQADAADLPPSNGGRSHTEKSTNLDRNELDRD